MESRCVRCTQYSTCDRVQYEVKENTVEDGENVDDCEDFQLHPGYYSDAMREAVKDSDPEEYERVEVSIRPEKPTYLIVVFHKSMLTQHERILRAQEITEILQMLNDEEMHIQNDEFLVSLVYVEPSKPEIPDFLPDDIGVDVEPEGSTTVIEPPSKCPVCGFPLELREKLYCPECGFTEGDDA